MAKYIKNIFFMLLFVVQVACPFDGSFSFELGLPDTVNAQSGEKDSRSFEERCGLGTGSAGDQDSLINSHPESGIFVIEDSGNPFDSSSNEWGSGLGFSNAGSTVADDYLNAEEKPVELLEGQGIGNDTEAEDCLIESPVLSVASSSLGSSSSSSASSSSDETGNTIKAFMAAVRQLPRIEKEGELYRCPIFECAYLAKRKDHLEIHLKSHNPSFVVCIFCKKELYTQDMTDSHHCKCSFCDVKCRKRGNVIKFMIEHVRERHPHLLAPLIGGSVPEECVPDSSSSSSSSFDSSSSEPAKTIEAFIAEVNRLARIEKDGELYKCPISGCATLMKIKQNLETHLNRHNLNFVVCIFCKKELYSQDIADSHRCKCSVCAIECYAHTGVIGWMANHVRERHAQLTKELGIIQIDEGFARSSDGSSPSCLVIQIENADSKITYTCVLCTYSTGKKPDMCKHLYVKHFNAPGIECPTCTSKIYEFDTTHRCKFPSEPRFTQAYLDAYPQFTEATCKELPELRSVKKGTHTHYTCPYCDSWSHTSIPELNYHIYRCHTLARKDICSACEKPMYMKVDLEKHYGKCPVKDFASNSSSSSSSSLLALTSALSASKSKRGRPSSPDVRKDAEAEPKRLCTPSSLQPANLEPIRAESVLEQNEQSSVWDAQFFMATQDDE